jgi:pyruvate-ferredoxin/flavodoxin oxidoreductase
MHSVGGWGAITTGKNLTLAVYEMLGLHVKANPKYGSEKKGQPTTFFAVFAPERIRLNGELKHVDVVLSPDPRVFQRADPLAGLAKGGVFVCQADGTPADFWASVPAAARHPQGARDPGVAGGRFQIAKAEASEPELVFRLQGAAFMGRSGARRRSRRARVSTRSASSRGGPRSRRSSESWRQGGGGQPAGDPRGFEEVVEVDVAALPEGVERGRAAAPVPSMVGACPVAAGIGDPGRFWEQVGSVQAAGQDVLSDPFTAISAIPAATGVFRDMTGIRQEVPQFVADRCTGCGQCWCSARTRRSRAS